MWVWVGAAHDRAFVLNHAALSGDPPVSVRKDGNLKDLDVFDTILSTSESINANPFVDNSVDVFYRKPCKSQIMSWMEDQDVASPMNGIADQEGMGGHGCNGNGWRQHCSIIVHERKGVLKRWVPLAARPRISWAKIAFWIVSNGAGRLGRFRLAKPRTLITMGRNKDVLVGEGVVCACELVREGNDERRTPGALTSTMGGVEFHRPAVIT